jgi:hypothetical protein
MVFVAESFPLPLARKLTTLILDGQGGGGAMRLTSTTPAIYKPAANLLSANHAGTTSTRATTQASTPTSTPTSTDSIGGPLSGDLVRFFANCGVMKSAVDAMTRAASAHSAMLH